MRFDDSLGAVDLMLFLAPILTREQQNLEIPVSLQEIVEYSLGTEIGSSRFREIEDRAVREERLGDLLIEAWRIVEELQRKPGEVSPAEDPLRAEVAFFWKRRGDQAATRKAKAGLLDYLLPMFGRESEANALEQLLGAPGTRSVVVTGIGGVGKTTLVANVARRLRGPAWAVECGELADPEELYSEIAHALDLVVGGDARAPVQDHLSSRAGVLVLDRVDALPWISEEAAALLEAAPGLRILATAQVSSGLPGGEVFPLHELALAGESNRLGEAMDLFVEVAARIVRGFKLTAENLPQVRSLCQLAMGLPLSIAITAGCLNQRDLPDLVDQLQQSPQMVRANDLRGTLDSTIDYAFRLLSAQDRALLGQLSVWVGQSTVEDMVMLSDATPSEVSRSIVELCKSRLLECELVGERAFYRLHDSVRRQVVSETPDLEIFRARHAVFFAKRAEAIGRDMASGRWTDGISKLLPALGNFRIATQHAAEAGDHRLLTQLADGLSRTLFESGLLADFDVLSNAANRSAEATLDLALKTRMLGLQGALASRRGNEDACRRIWEERQRLCEEIGDVAGAADTLTDLALQAFDMGEIDRSVTLLDQAEALLRDGEELELVSTVYVIRARMWADQGNADEARIWIAKAEEMLARGKDRTVLLFVYQSLVMAYRKLGEQDLALERAIELLRQASEGDRVVMTGWALREMGPMYESKGNLDVAAQCFVASVGIYREYITKGLQRAIRMLEEFEERSDAQMRDRLQNLRSLSSADLIEAILRAS